MKKYQWIEKCYSKITQEICEVGKQKDVSKEPVSVLLSRWVSCHCPSMNQQTEHRSTASSPEL